mmetsp:Transcript_27698/g.80284  ORF Transcript_27698/g.80284 Transcript_27698/m.80284 type:complete len:559 (-) Transcript_27698:79-1755(-)
MAPPSLPSPLNLQAPPGASNTGAGGNSCQGGSSSSRAPAPHSARRRHASAAGADATAKQGIGRPASLWRPPGLSDSGGAFSARGPHRQDRRRLHGASVQPDNYGCEPIPGLASVRGADGAGGQRLLPEIHKAVQPAHNPYDWSWLGCAPSGRWVLTKGVPRCVHEDEGEEEGVRRTIADGNDGPSCPVHLYKVQVEAAPATVDETHIWPEVVAPRDFLSVAPRSSHNSSKAPPDDGSSASAATTASDVQLCPLAQSCLKSKAAAEKVAPKNSNAMRKVLHARLYMQPNMSFIPEPDDTHASDEGEAIIEQLHHMCNQDDKDSEGLQRVNMAATLQAGGAPMDAKRSWRRAQFKLSMLSPMKSRISQGRSLGAAPTSPKVPAMRAKASMPNGLVQSSKDNADAGRPPSAMSATTSSQSTPAGPGGIAMTSTASLMASTMRSTKGSVLSHIIEDRKQRDLRGEIRRLRDALSSSARVTFTPEVWEQCGVEDELLKKQQLVQLLGTGFALHKDNNGLEPPEGSSDKSPPGSASRKSAKRRQAVFPRHRDTYEAPSLLPLIQ